MNPRPTPSPFSPITIGPLTLKNRFIKSATNEGMSAQGVPSKQLVKLHSALVAGGTAMTTVAYCAVSDDGRTLPNQLTLTQSSLPHFKALTDGVHQSGGLASAQITHGGCFTFIRERSTKRPLSASGGFNKIGLMSGMFLKQAMNEDDMQLVVRDFAQGARLARQAGFDAVEIHMGHGYLLSQFISPMYNKRRDQYGGSLENRLRFPRRVLRAVLDAVGNDMAVICKYSVTEGVRAGNSAEDGAQIARMLEEEGAHLLVLSAGMNAESITTMFGSSFPKENRVQQKNKVIALAMAIQRRKEPTVEFRELYLLEHARKVRAAVKMPLAYLGGAKSLASIEKIMAEGFDLVAMGRVLLAENDYVNKLESGASRDSICTACNRCVAMMYTPGGTSCVLGQPGDAVLNSQKAADR
ncbi:MULTISPECIES: NADH:flavin oxidoreductase [Pseudomonas]|jgi:2,4-dienoyl-CoA reductase (NADPH2)|uniref:NADH oxidase n=1 Tax=Pseudomonas fluorescens TaxID=294 RepID=A0A5E7S5E3_PSEFL|nr:MULTISPECIES: NADH:flavin oxidoreductase [Pseudomonas]QCY12984.1 NADH:flavin oxidoreductase [Pseudomonas sp. MPC6]VVP81250.1 NADH oxidase [Pseudomonas fluorescens]VVQ25057.1 NADH oxidase [Pseudomonas fluorescens]